MKTQEETEQITRENMQHRMAMKAGDFIKATFGALTPDWVSAEGWLHFRDFLITDEAVDQFRSDKDFKWGIQLVIYVVESLEKIDTTAIGNSPSNDRHYQLLKDYFIGELLLGDDSDYKAVLELMKALRIYENEKVRGRYSRSADEFWDLKTDLETIERCQRIAMEAARYRV